LAHDFSPHIHDYNQLTIVTGGSADIFMGDKVVPMREGHVYVTDPFSPHGMLNVKKLEQTYLLFYSQELLKYADPFFTRAPAFQSLFVLAPQWDERGLSKHFCLSFSDLQYVSQLIDVLLLELAQKKTGYEVMIQSHFMALVVFLSRAYEGYRGTDPSFEDRALQIASYLTRNSADDSSMEEFGRRFHLSPRQLRRLFEKRYGHTPLQYRMERRLDHARYLLENSSRSISAVAQECGFCDSNYFSRSFSQRFGSSPRRWRELVAGPVSR
jgi:AraC-like DNA-binding protein